MMYTTQTSNGKLIKVVHHVDLGHLSLPVCSLNTRFNLPPRRLRYAFIASFSYRRVAGVPLYLLLISLLACSPPKYMQLCRSLSPETISRRTVRLDWVYGCLD